MFGLLFCHYSLVRVLHDIKSSYIFRANIRYVSDRHINGVLEKW